MSAITATFSQTNVEATTRQALLEKFLRESQLGAYGTATGGSTSTIVDTTKLQSTQYASDDWVGGWARISYDAGAAGAAPQGEIRVITTYAPSTGTITVNPAFTVAVASADKYELWRMPHPQDVLDSLDDILVNGILLPCWSPLSELPDYDMEQSGTTDWPGTNATPTKVSTEPVLNGSRWLSVLNTAINGYAQSVTLLVEPSTSYMVSALGRATAAATTATMTVRDVTNGADIDSVTSVRQFAHRLWTVVATPATCYQMAIRLGAAENAVTTAWDDVIVYPLGGGDIALPWWVRTPSQVKGVYSLSRRGVADSIWDAALVGEQTDGWHVQDAPRGGGHLRLVSRDRTLGSEGPLFIYGLRNLSAYSNDHSDTKLIDRDFLAAYLGVRVFELLGRLPAAGPLDAQWIGRERDAWERRFRREKAAVDAAQNQPDKSPKPQVGYLRSWRR